MMAIDRSHQRIRLKITTMWVNEMICKIQIFWEKLYNDQFYSINYISQSVDVVIHFWILAQKIKKMQRKTIKKYSQKKKIIAVKIRCRSAHKMVKNWLRRFKNTKIKIWQYFVDWWEPCWQRKFNLRKKSSKSDIYELNYILLKV